MFSQIARFLGVALLFGSVAGSWGQDVQPPQTGEVPKGVEVQARGPVHEAFATPLAEAQATPLIPRKPPAPIEELAPEERPEGDAAWIGGYWGWDDERRDFLWVSGCWRVKPAGKDWVPGYWRETGGQWQWVAGFWTTVQNDRQQQLTYFPQPPAPPQVAPPAPAAVDEFHVPGYWLWYGDRYVWRAGYSTRVRPGYVYIASHYRWTPNGYLFIPGYWDFDIAQRGLLYAPVIIDPVVVGPTFVYTPRYAVTDTLVLDAFFVRPAYCHYYFGDYYGPNYVQFGFEPCVVYSRRCYEPIIVYRQWEYRQTPRWLEVQIAFSSQRSAGLAPVPPRTLVQQNTIIQNNITVNNTVNNITVNKATALAPATSILAARGQRAVPLDADSRTLLQKSASTVQQSSAAGRQQNEQPTSAPPSRPRVATLNLPAAPPARVNGTLSASPTAYPVIPIQREDPKVGSVETPRGLPAAKQTNAAPTAPALEPNLIGVPPKGRAVTPPLASQLHPVVEPPKGPVATQSPSLPNGTGTPSVGLPAYPTPPLPVPNAPPGGPGAPAPAPSPPNGIGPGRAPLSPARPNVQRPPARPTAPPPRDDDRKKGNP